jgi:adenylate cyclase
MAATSEPVRALLVDDDVNTSSVYLRRLTEEGYEVTTATDPAVALSLAAHNAPNVIFVHVGAEGSGSTAFIASLRASDDTRHIPVQVLTSYYRSSLEGTGMTPMSRESW